MMRLRPIALAVCAVFGAAHAQQPHETDATHRGKMLNDDMSFIHGTPPSTELPLQFVPPAGLTASDVLRMRDAVRTLPQKPPVETRSLQYTLTGALFASGQDILTAQARAQLDTLAAKVQGKAKLKLSIVGHTDN